MEDFMKQDIPNTLDFAVAEDHSLALQASDHQTATAEPGTLRHDNSYRPWNTHFEDPSTPLDLPSK
jgi:hypothetical protein